MDNLPSWEEDAFLADTDDEGPLSQRLEARMNTLQVTEPSPSAATEEPMDTCIPPTPPKTPQNADNQAPLKPTPISKFSPQPSPLKLPTSTSQL